LPVSRLGPRSAPAPPAQVPLPSTPRHRRTVTPVDEPVPPKIQTVGKTRDIQEPRRSLGLAHGTLEVPLRQVGCRFPFAGGPTEQPSVRAKGQPAFQLL